jgi:hypothetical protein
MTKLPGKSAQSAHSPHGLHSPADAHEGREAREARERRTKRETAKRPAAGGASQGNAAGAVGGRGRSPSSPTKAAALERPALDSPRSPGAGSKRPAGPGNLERGARVNVTSGPFAGKTGIVQDLVGRRSARVMLGLLPVQIDLDDLTPSAAGPGGRGRPRLSSSHRKPVPARS